MTLVEKAVAREEGPFWNENGIYFAENGAIVSFTVFLLPSEILTGDLELCRDWPSGG